MDSLKIDSLIVDLKKQQAFWDSLAIINQDIQIIGIQVDSLVRWHGLRENTPEEVHQFTNMMMDVLDQIIRLTPTVSKSLEASVSEVTVIKQATRLPALADSIDIITHQLHQLTTLDQAKLDDIENEIRLMENSLASLISSKTDESGEELIKDPIPDGDSRKAEEVEHLLTLYQNIDFEAKVLKSVIETCLSNENCNISDQQGTWVKMLQSIQKDLNAFFAQP